MRVSPWMLGAALAGTVALCGCSGADRGQSENTRVTSVAYKGQEDKGLGHKVVEGTRDTTDALHITPKVKGAIIADGQLNDRRNHINVDTKDYILHLKGHVYSKAMKMRAGSIATAKLAKMHKNYKVSNELTIGK